MIVTVCVMEESKRSWAIMRVTEYQSSQFWFHIKSSHSLPSLSKKHISLCQLLTIELAVAEFKSPGCDSCGPWSGVSQRASQTFLTALWLTMGTITSAAARHSPDERKRRSDGLFSEGQLSGQLYSLLCAFFYLPFLSLFTFSFCLDRIASHLRNIIWFEIQHFPLCNVLGSSAHALCRSLISIHSLLKCSSIHLERMLRLALRVERILLNERWQRPALQQYDLLYRKRLQTLSHFFIASTGCYPVHWHISCSPTSDHISSQNIFSPILTGNEMSHSFYQRRMYLKKGVFLFTPKMRAYRQEN